MSPAARGKGREGLVPRRARSAGRLRGSGHPRSVSLVKLSVSLPRAKGRVRTFHSARAQTLEFEASSPPPPTALPPSTSTSSLRRDPRRGPRAGTGARTPRRLPDLPTRQLSLRSGSPPPPPPGSPFHSWRTARPGTGGSGGRRGGAGEYPRGPNRQHSSK